MSVSVSQLRRSSPLLWLIPLAAVAWTLAMLAAPDLIRLLAFGLVGVVAFVAATWKWPKTMAALMPVTMIPPQFLKLFAYEVFLAVLFAVLVTIGWKRRSAWLGRLSRVEILVLLMLVWGAFSIFWVRDSWWWLFGVRKYLVGFLALWVSWRLVRFVKPELMLTGVAAGACAVALATVAQASRTGFFTAASVENMRRTATELGWGAANFLAALIALMLPTCIYLAMHAKHPLARLLGWASIPMAAILVTIAASRGGTLMLLAIALFAIFRSKIKPWMAITTSVMLVAMLLLGPGGGANLFSRFTDLEDIYSIVVRFIYFREAWFRTVDHWPVGMGMGQGLSFPDRLGDDDPHNYWLVLSSEFGLVGLLLWIGQIIVIWSRIGVMVRNPETEQPGRALQLTFVIAQLNLIFEPTFQGLQYQALFYWIFGAYFGAFPPPTTAPELREAPAVARTPRRPDPEPAPAG